MLRAIKQVIKARSQTEGGGFQIRRALPAPGVRYIDPILLIDEMGPVDYRPGEPVVQHGPFVMNTQQEIGQAIHDYQQGRMGIIQH